MAGISTADADVAGEGFIDLIYSGVGVLVKQVLGGYQETGGAVAALHSVPAAVSIDQGLPLGVSCDAFYGLDFLAFALDGEHLAGENCAAVHDDGAGAANALVTHVLSAGETEAELQGALEGPVGFDENLAALAVEGKYNCNRGDGADVLNCIVLLKVSVAAEDLAAERATIFGESGGDSTDHLGNLSVSSFESKGHILCFCHFITSLEKWGQGCIKADCPHD